MLFYFFLEKHFQNITDVLYPKEIVFIGVIWPKEISSDLSYTQNNDCN